jgi:hypothetical protein
MKKLLSATVLLPLALAGSVLIAQDNSQQPPADQSQTQQDSKKITGKIARSDDGKYVLIDSAGTMYQLDDQSTAKRFAGKKVKVSGTVDANHNTIHVTEIKAS